VRFYAEAFGAVERYQHTGSDGRVAVAQLELGGARFWLQEDERASDAFGDVRSVRMIVVAADPDALFARALATGARQVAAMHEEHGWRTGRVMDPFGHDWEFGRLVGAE
jgi:PhnB protein